MLGEGVQTFRPQELCKAADFPHAGGVRANQLRAITGAAVIRATVGGRVLSLQLSVSKWLHYEERGETVRIGSTRQSMNGARMDTSEGRRRDRASVFPSLLFPVTLALPSSSSVSVLHSVVL